MLKRLVIKGVGTSIVQVVAYALLLQTGSVVSGFFNKPQHKGVDWGLTIYFSFVLLAAIVFIINLTTTLINNKWFTWIAVCLASLFYIIGWGEDFDRHPFRTLYLISLGLCCLLSKLFIDRRLEQLS